MGRSYEHDNEQLSNEWLCKKDTVAWVSLPRLVNSTEIYF